MSVLLPTAGLSLTRDEVLADYRVAVRSRIASQVGHREVLAGAAKFGIFGDGKEVAQVALAKTFAPGDWRMYERLILRTEDALAGYDAPYAKSNIAEIRFLETELVSFYQRLAVWRHRGAEPMARRLHSPDGDAY